MSRTTFFKKNAMPNFFNLMESQCTISLQGVDELICYIDERCQESYDAIERFEKEADMVRKELIMGAKAVFITPIERHDMFALSRRIDDIMDKIKDIKDLIEILDIDLPEDITEIAKICRDSIDCLREAIINWDCKNQDKFWEYLIKAKKSENAIKRIYWKIVLQIDEKTMPLSYVVRMREISKDMNELGNKIGKAADNMGDIKMKMMD